jgi:hypothetical protein
MLWQPTIRHGGQATKSKLNPLIINKLSNPQIMATNHYFRLQHGGQVTKNKLNLLIINKLSNPQIKMCGKSNPQLCVFSFYSILIISIILYFIAY